jgi:hypothetical protein
VPDTTSTVSSTQRCSGSSCSRLAVALTLLGTSRTSYRTRYKIHEIERLHAPYAQFIFTSIFSQEQDSINGKRKGLTNKDNDKMIYLIRSVLLYQYKISPNAYHYLRREASLHVDPFDRMMQVAAPDSIDAVCNIYEMFRSILFSLGEGNFLFRFSASRARLPMRLL